MPAYRFEAIDAQGKPRTGLLEGDNAKAVRSQLRSQGLVPLGVEAVAAALASTGRVAFHPPHLLIDHARRSGPASSPVWSPLACRWNAP